MFLLGLLGTGHCVGMCGPLVVAFPARSGNFTSHLCYHCGRIITYALIGALVGSLGAGLERLAGGGTDHLLWVARLQVGFSLVAAVFLLLFGLSRLDILGEPAWIAKASPAEIPGYNRLIRTVLGKDNHGTMFLLGLMMGLLPCGLSFAAFARALPFAAPLTGGGLLLAFGVGTVPGLLLVGTGAAQFFRRFRRISDILSGLLMIGMGVSLLADGVMGLAG